MLIKMLITDILGIHLTVIIVSDPSDIHIKVNCMKQLVKSETRISNPFESENRVWASRFSATLYLDEQEKWFDISFV